MSERKKMNSRIQFFPQNSNYRSRFKDFIDLLEPIEENKLLGRKVGSARSHRPVKIWPENVCLSKNDALSRKRSYTKIEKEVKRPVTADGLRSKARLDLDKFNDKESILHTVKELVDWLKSWKEKNDDNPKVCNDLDKKSILHPDFHNREEAKQIKTIQKPQIREEVDPVNKGQKKQDQYTVTSEFSYVPYSRSQKVRTNISVLMPVAKTQRVPDSPSSRPSSQKSNRPSSQKSNRPSSQKSNRPSSQKSNRPSSQKSNRPSSQKSNRPSSQKSNRPSSSKSNRPKVESSGMDNQLKIITRKDDLTTKRRPTRPGTASSKRGIIQIPNSAGKPEMKVFLSERNFKTDQNKKEDPLGKEKDEIKKLIHSGWKTDDEKISATDAECKVVHPLTLVSMYSPLESKHENKRKATNKNEVKKSEEKNVVNSRIPRRKLL